MARYIENPNGEPESASVIESVIFPYIVEESDEQRYDKMVIAELKAEEQQSKRKG